MRCCNNSTEGLKRGMEVVDSGHFVLGRIFNVLGIPIDQSVANDRITNANANANANVSSIGILSQVY